MCWNESNINIAMSEQEEVLRDKDTDDRTKEPAYIPWTYVAVGASMV